MRCPSCGANNPDSAAWCGLCLTKLGGAGASAGDSPADASGGEAAPEAIRLDEPGEPQGAGADRPTRASGTRPPAEASAGSVIRRGDTVSWRCPGCDRENPIDEDRCAVCGTSLYQIFGPSEPPGPPGPPRDPRIAAALSVVPGAGHFYIRRPGEGVVRLVLGAWWLAGALLIDASLRFFAPLRAVYLLAFLGLAAVSAVEAFRQARVPRTPPLLSRKVVLWATGALVAVSVAWVVLGATAARR